MKIQTLMMRPLYGLATALLLFSTSLLVLSPSLASAGQVTTRYIKMSSSTPSATGVKYDVAFTVASSYTLKAIVIDFCDHTSTPLIGDSTCTQPTGFTVSGSPTITNNPDTIATINVGAWTASSMNSGRTFKLVDATGAAVTSASVVNFSIDTVTNTSDVGATNGTFYARLLTYNTNAPSYSPGSEGAYSDYGGFALATAAAISITARVMESLSFCVYADDNGGGAGTGSCGTAPTIIIGHGGNNVLDASAVDFKLIDFDLSTNANGGAKVNVKGDTLKSGANDINAKTSVGTLSAGTENFGININTAGGFTADSSYSATAGQYYFDPTTATTTYGQALCHVATPINGATVKLDYSATAANTTPAGIYTATHQLIATGTF